MNELVKIDHQYQGGDNFNFFPIKMVDAPCDLKPNESFYSGDKRIIMDKSNLFSINEWDFQSLISMMLIRHFVEASNYPFRNCVLSIKDPFTTAAEIGWYQQEEDYGFNQYEVFNVYSYESIRHMIEDIRTVSQLLIVNPYNPEIMKYTYHFKLMPYELDEQENWSLEKRAQWMADKVYRAVDFYNRFIAELETMMSQSPDYEYINFEGY